MRTYSRQTRATSDELLKEFDIPYYNILHLNIYTADSGKYTAVHNSATIYQLLCETIQPTIYTDYTARRYNQLFNNTNYQLLCIAIQLLLCIANYSSIT